MTRRRLPPWVWVGIVVLAVLMTVVLGILGYQAVDGNTMNGDALTAIGTVGAAIFTLLSAVAALLTALAAGRARPPRAAG